MTQTFHESATEHFKKTLVVRRQTGLTIVSGLISKNVNSATGDDWENKNGSAAELGFSPTAEGRLQQQPDLETCSCGAGS